MMKGRWGRVINITSVVGETGAAGQANYAASKAGLIGLTKSLAREFASRNITVNAVAPGFIQTAMTDDLQDAQKAAILAQVPLARYGSDTDVAAEITAAGGTARTYALDVSSEESIKACAKAVLADLGKVEILVNNAGITKDGLTLRMKLTDFDDVLRTNLTGAFLLT